LANCTFPTLNQNTTGTAAVSTAATVTTSATASAFKVPFANTTASTTGNYGLLQDSEATFTYNPSTNTLVVGTVSAALSGNATTATTLQTARTIGGVSFNGSANINLPGVDTAGNQNTTGTAAGITGKTTPTGALVGTTDTQTLTGKTITFADNTLTGVAGVTATQTLTNKTAERLILNDGYTEEVFAITDGATVNLDPNNGSIQTWTLGDNRTPDQANWAAGQSITLMVDDGTARTITWTTLAPVWETNGGNAPTLALTGFTVIVLWKVGTTIYGARVGDN
jgi:hypothetical protein